MRISEITSLLEAELHTSNHDPDLDIYSACGADLMSDVMAFSKENAMMITGLVNPQVIRTAEMMDIRVVVFVRGKKPQGCMVAMAEEKGIAVLSTALPMFSACGRLYRHGIHGRGES
jgi:hypothetical protein